MSDYAMFEGKQVKIGRNGMMFYLRWNQKGSVSAVPGGIAPADRLESIWFRIPKTSERNMKPSDFPYDGWCGAKPVRFVVRKDKDGDTSLFEKRLMEDMRGSGGSIVEHSDKVGVDIAVPCYHGYTGESLPDNMRYNDFKSSTLGIAAVGIRSGKPVALLGCLACGKVLPGCYFLEDIEDNCEPFEGEEDDWNAILETMRDMKSFIGQHKPEPRSESNAPSFRSPVACDGNESDDED